ncbi:MAG: hypothetical protein HPY85_08720 [Anaerolineae bacterium]|nr:hypothetical protein [Anaerolineae bacterium]
MNHSPNHHRPHHESIEVTEEMPGRPFDTQPPSLWKQALTITVFLAGLALLATAMAYGMAWLVNLG